MRPEAAPRSSRARLRRLPDDLRILGRILALWPLAAVLKRRRSLPRLGSAFDATAAKRSLEPLRAARLIDGLLRRAYRRRPGYCVERSLILFHLLRRGGLPAELCFGVRRSHDGEITGHAWVTLDGKPVAEHADPRLQYAPTYTYTPADVCRPC